MEPGAPIGFHVLCHTAGRDDSATMADAKARPAGAVLASLAAASGLAADPAAGSELFASWRAPCAGCHRFRGSGSGTLGPDLSDAGERFGVSQLIALMLHPTSEIMPSARTLGSSAQEVADLAAYLSSAPLLSEMSRVSSARAASGAVGALRTDAILSRRGVTERSAAPAGCILRRANERKRGRNRRCAGDGLSFGRCRPSVSGSSGSSVSTRRLLSR